MFSLESDPECESHAVSRWQKTKCVIAQGDTDDTWINKGNQIREKGMTDQTNEKVLFSQMESDDSNERK